MIRLHVLGTARLVGNQGQELREVLVKPKSLALLAYLALAAPRGFVRRDSLLALFWPESDSSHARNALRQTIHHLRHALGEGVLVGRGAEELGVEAEQIWCDAVAFGAALDRSATAEALALYGGDLLPGFFVADCLDYERWLDEQRLTLRERAQEAAWRVAETELTAGDAAAAVHWARWAARLSPGDETSVRRLIALLLRAGDRASATRAYEDFSARLRQEYGMAPAPETGALLAARGQPASAAHPATSPGVVPAASRPAREPGGRRATPTAWRRLAIAALFIVAVASLQRMRLHHSAIASEGSVQTVVVLPFLVRGHDSLAYLGAGMVELLSSRLDGAPRLRSVDPRAVWAATAGVDSAVRTDPARASRLAARLGADLYVIGAAVEIAGRLQLDAALMNRSGTQKARATVEGETAHVLELSDRLAALLLAGQAGGSDTALTVLAGGTTRSLPAFKSYLAGEAAFSDGRYVQAVEAFQRAVAQDSGFALGYYRLAVAADWAGATYLSTQSAAEAARRLDRLSPFAQNLLQGFKLYSARAADGAEGAYLEIAGTHPDNLEAAYMLGEVRFHYNSQRGRSTNESREQFERVLAIAPGDGPALIHLARVAALEHNVAELDTLTGRYLRLYTDADRGVEMRALRAFAAGDRREQDRIISALRSQGNAAVDVVTRGVGVFDQDLAGASRLAVLYVMPGRPLWVVPRGYELLAQVAVGRGRWVEARRQLDSLSAIRPDWAVADRADLALVPNMLVRRAELSQLQSALAAWRPAARADPPERFAVLAQLRAYLLGRVALRTGDSAAVRSSEDELERLARTSGDSGVATDLLRVVQAEGALQGGRAAEALGDIAQFRFTPASHTARSLYSVSPHARFLRGEILEALGREQEALRWYSSFPDPTGVDLAFLGLAHLRQAEIEERLGRSTEALAHYDRFIMLWQDCDEALRPTVDQARRAAASLRRSHGD